jgi:serine/threonine-protein kinase RsbW
VGGGSIIGTESKAESQRIAAEALIRHQDELCQRVSDRCFAELDSYKFGTMPREESRATVNRLLAYIVKALITDTGCSEESESASHEGESVHEDIVSVEEGIAARRVKMAIQFEDLIRGIQFMRREIWTTLQESNLGVPADSIFVIERKINDIFDAFFLGLSTSYRQSQTEAMREQEEALEQWEEVVKSASEIRLKIPCREEFAKIVRLQAEAIARRVYFTEDEIYDIITAVGEVCDNAIEHGVSEQGIDVQYFLSPSELKVEVQDYGPGFDAEKQGFEPPDLFAEDGRGLFLMKSLMDLVEIDSGPSHGQSTRGTRVRIAKFRIPPSL